MSKFKVGDKVRILDGSKIKNYTCGWTLAMSLYIGKVYTIKSVDSDWSDDRVSYDLNEIGYLWDERGLELVSESKIVITTDGTKTVTARLYEGKKVIKTAEAKCSLEDEFDFGIGAALAVGRLTGHESIEEVADDKSSFKDVIDSLEQLIKFSEKILARGKSNGPGKNL